MTEEQKTIAIDTTAVLEKQREHAAGARDVPMTVAIDGEELAQRLEAARRERAAEPAPAAPRAWRLWLAAAFAVGVITAYLAMR